MCCVLHIHILFLFLFASFSSTQSCWSLSKLRFGCRSGVNFRYWSCHCFQATSALASIFIVMAHNVTGAEPTETMRWASASDDVNTVNPFSISRNEPYFYESGWKDGAAVFFYTLICIIMHAILQEYVLDVSCSMFTWKSFFKHFSSWLLESFQETPFIEI